MDHSIQNLFSRNIKMRRKRPERSVYAGPQMVNLHIIFVKQNKDLIMIILNQAGSY